MSKSNSKSVSECPCCYGDCYEGDMLECSANLGHVVCKTCIGNYVIEQLDGKNSAQFECFVAENCNCQLGELVLIKALPKEKACPHSPSLYDKNSSPKANCTTPPMAKKGAILVGLS